MDARLMSPPSQSAPVDAVRRKVLVLNDRYQTSFMTPRKSRHEIIRRRFLPFNYLSGKYDGFTVPMPGQSVDLVHAHNRIPLFSGRRIISFESHLPRHFGLGANSLIVSHLRRNLLRDSCRRIVAMSHFAKRTFEAQISSLCEGERSALMAKLIVRHPNVEVPEKADSHPADEDTGPIRLVFVGGHFARKGGGVALAIAEKAHDRGLPIEVTVISSLDMGERVWTDPTVPGSLDHYARFLELPNVTHLGGQPNAVVRQHFAGAHFGLLPTFADTFGFSAIECMSEHTPMIATRTGALPEFMTDGVNGILLDVPTTETGEWAGLDYQSRGSEDYAQRFRNTEDMLAEQTLARLAPFLADRRLLVPIRRAARQTVRDMFASGPGGRAWDSLYDRVIAEDIRSPVSLDPLHDASSPDGWPGIQGA